MKAEVVIMGLGYIGLPTSALIASRGTKVLGVDINPDVVDTINLGEIHIVEPELAEVVKKAVLEGDLVAKTKPEKADVFLIVVPTPFKENYEPDISFVEQATYEVIPLLKEGDLYVLESTSPIGTTEKMQEIIYSERPELEGKIFMAYCPERVLPGNVMYELEYNDRVIGGIDQASTERAIKFYSQYVKGELHSSNARTAEMCKLVENSSRDVEIAFANELSMICEKFEVDVWELINLANKHPRVNILKPGSGVGGHCIAVDPYFILSALSEESRIIRSAREVNNFKPMWCIEKIRSTALQFKIDNDKQPKLALLGLTYKPNIDDLRESPAVFIAETIAKEFNKENCFIVEPNIKSHPNHELTHYTNAIDQSDIIVFLVGHKQFKDLTISPDKIILDFCGIRN